MALEQSPAEQEAFITAMDRLGGFDERMNAEWADGYLTALAAGPRAVAIEEWLPAMCGDAFERCFADPADATAAHAVLAAHARLLARQLDPERLLDMPDDMHLTPLVQVWDDDTRAEAVADGELPLDERHLFVTGGDWSRGFFEAIRDFAIDWAQPAAIEDADEFDELAAQVGILGWPDDSPEMAAHLKDFSDAQRPNREDLIDIACSAVQDLRVWWLDHAAKPPTVHAPSKPGRNETCDCGSGKKYKKCHGA